ncbi:uncharacterized protein SAPINGB_P003161 [Magnusiomyces paraingens]|uniref:Cytochrome b-c1 complex subunit 10 n=1 Tax=Magnusiomyces paraingens TaxID=2606893 RepID=A0A5E8BSC2_9ASCO|nr:uncharacterized protein SAPINGB_P003161 [Saprochaete ingens]VVT51633.1 unnamed protein product [Saprochaete ingens]
MAAKQYKLAPAYKPVPHLLNFTISNTLKWSPILTFWGGSALVGVLFFADSIPRLQRDIFQYIPLIGSAYVKNVPASDSPF